MFEKEAEEYANKRAKELWINECNFAYATMRRAYQKGAEYGYNKAKEEMVQNGLALQSDMDKTIEQNISLKEQIEKMKLCQNCKFEDCDYLEEPCSVCSRCLGEDIKRKGNSDKWEKIE